MDAIQQLENEFRKVRSKMFRRRIAKPASAKQDQAPRLSVPSAVPPEAPLAQPGQSGGAVEADFGGLLVAERPADDEPVAEPDMTLERDAVDALVAAAEAARQAGDRDEALRLWAPARAHRPRPRVAFQRAAAVLQELGRLDATESEYVMRGAVPRGARRFDEAETMLQHAHSRFGDSRGILGELAWLAHARQDLTEATARWKKFRAHLPSDAAWFLGALQPLLLTHKLDDADTLLESAVETLPQNPRLRLEHARLARFRGDWQAAVVRWEAVRALQPDLAEAYSEGVRSLIGLCRDDEADTLLVTALARFPANAEIAHLHSDLARRQEQ